MTLTVRAYTAADAHAWDAFCAGALQATLLHTRRFLSYHGDRFLDRSVIIERDGKWMGVMPAALDRIGPNVVVSHPGATYGGIVHQGALRGGDMLAALERVQAYFAEQGCTTLLYKAVPTLYHQAPVQDDLHALFRLGAARVRCDLSNTIDLNHRMALDGQRRRGLKKAEMAGVEVVEGPDQLPPFWDVLRRNLVEKHGVKPVHTLDEITLLATRFPEEILCICAYVNGVVVAGTVLFVTPTAFHAQYIANSENGQRIGALDRVFAHCIDSAARLGRRWFDFGISTEDQGRFLNDGLYRFKAGFGGGGVIHEFFELNLHR